MFATIEPEYFSEVSVIKVHGFHLLPSNPQDLLDDLLNNCREHIGQLLTGERFHQGMEIHMALLSLLIRR